VSAERAGAVPPAASGWTPALRVWVAAWSLGAVALCAALALGPLAGIPHVQDEVVYTLQARSLAAGELWSPLPRPLASRVYDFLLDSAKGRAGVFPNGWPAVLALGERLRAPWLIDPLLAGLVVLLGSALARHAGGRDAAVLAAPLLALSPQAALLGASRMSHTLAALLALLALRAALERERDFGLRAGLALGAPLAALALVRPWDAVLVALVLLPVAFAGRPRRTALAGCAAALALGGALAGAQNLLLTGDPLTFAQTRYYASSPPPVPGDSWRFAAGCNALGFGADRGCFMTRGSFGHTPAKAALDLAGNAGLAGRLWLGTPAVWLLGLAALGWRETRRFALVAWSLLTALAAGYAVYWYGGACYGARFWHAALAPMVVAVALGTATALRRAGLRPWLGLVLLLPMAFRLERALPEMARYWGIDDRFARLEQSWDRAPALVLVAYRSELALTHPRETTGEDLLAAPHRWRAAWLPAEGPIRFEEYQPELVDALEAANPGRPVWLYEMAADEREDRLRPLASADRAPIQRADLPLPAALPLLPAPRRAGDLWSGAFRVVDAGQRP
jgi:hypothetical protein